jgi:DNA modification methylase
MTPYHVDPLVTLYLGDCIEVMAGLEADSVDAVVTDPPYGLEFMGKEWDAFRSDDPGTNRHRGKYAGKKGDLKAGDNSTVLAAGRVAYGGGERPKTNRCVGCGKRDQFRNPHACPEGTPWKSELIDPYAAPPSSLAFQNWCRTWALAALRVTKPGGYLLAFGGTRTHHRLVCALEDAGWIIRDELDWIYASGFPKGKANLKPAHEPIVLARKPGPLRPLGIDACRIPGAEPYVYPNGPQGNTFTVGEGPDGTRTEPVESNPAGRWPSNVLLSDAELFDQANPYVVVSGATAGGSGVEETPFDGDSGGYSRFFIIPKADRAERERGLADHEKRPMGLGALAADGEKGEYLDFVHPAPEGIGGWLREQREAAGLQQKQVAAHFPSKTGGLTGCVANWELEFNRPTPDQWRTLREVIGFDDRYDEVMMATNPVRHSHADMVVSARANVHPTVKPIDLMRHLVPLVTPVDGVVLDPFLGSGTTALAASELGIKCIGIEREAEYLDIAKARLVATPMGMGLVSDHATVARRPARGHWPKDRPKGRNGWGFRGQEGLEERYGEAPNLGFHDPSETVENRGKSVESHDHSTTLSPFRGEG